MSEETKGILDAKQAENQLLKNELDELIKNNLKKDGKLKKEAKVADLSRIEELKKQLSIKDEKTADDVIEENKPEFSMAEKIILERELRRYVMKGGKKKVDDKIIEIPPGFRDGLPKEKVERAKLLLKKLGRNPEKPAWDMTIKVPGF